MCFKDVPEDFRCISSAFMVAPEVFKKFRGFHRCCRSSPGSFRAFQECSGGFRTYKKCSWGPQRVTEDLRSFQKVLRAFERVLGDFGRFQGHSRMFYGFQGRDLNPTKIP